MKMADFCLECLKEKIEPNANITNVVLSNVDYFCEGCGEVKPVVTEYNAEGNTADKELIQALECCGKYHVTNKEYYCNDCMFKGKGSCTAWLIDSLLGFISRQQKEKQNLEIELKAMRGAANSYKAEIERLQKENTELDGANILLTVTLQNAQTEARKELADKLKEHIAAFKYNINTPRKTVPMQTLHDQVNWILNEVVPETINKVLKELENN